MKICMKCQGKIKKKDNYIHLEQFEKGEKLREEYWHTDCFKNREKDSIKKLALGLTMRASKLMDKAEEHLA